MSRAFIRESDPGEPACPGCGTAGDAVVAKTLDAHVPADLRAALGEKAFYCVDSACPVAYFNGWGTSVPRERMVGPAWPKEAIAPICPCFGLRAEEVVEDAVAGRKERIRALAQRSQGPEARCLERSPDGRCCLPRVLRLFQEKSTPGS